MTDEILIFFYHLFPNLFVQDRLYLLITAVAKEDVNILLYLDLRVNSFFYKIGYKYVAAGNAKGGSITVLLTSCLTGLD